jgi:hypothetical protein
MNYEHEFLKLLFVVNQFILQPKSKAAFAALKNGSEYYKTVNIDKCTCPICISHAKQLKKYIRWKRRRSRALRALQESVKK